MPPLQFEKVHTANGFDFYAIWDGAAWLEDNWVRVKEGAPARDVEDAFFRNELVSNI